MNIEIRPIARKDFLQAIHFAIQGMHFARYTTIPWELQAYGRYFLFLELERATQVIAAYDGKHLVGILMAEIKDEPKPYHSIWRKLYVLLGKAVLAFAYRNSSDAYDAANERMMARYLCKHTPDGEICLLAADPTRQGQGIGTLLLNALTHREKGKRICLFTDSNCTWQFYEKRGFERVAEESVSIEVHGTSAPLACYLYSKVL